MKVVNVVGARPNFMKIAPIHRAMENSTRFESLIVHTGQHYDEQMSEIFFEQLELPEPDLYLGVGSGSHAGQTARIMTAFEEVVLAEEPDLVLVVGDVNSTLACSLVAAKLQVPVAHVEAGLRSGDRSMPEEINRIVVDRLSDYLFVTEESGVENLKKEGTPSEKVHFVGNVMIDSLVFFKERASRVSIVSDLNLDDASFVLMTMHRPSNVDSRAPLEEVVRMMEGIAENYPLVFPMHPRTRERLREFDLWNRVKALDNLVLLEPQGYLEFLQLMNKAGVVVTDSGGIQEETTFLGVPCLTVRENTERPITIHQGTNELVPLESGTVVKRVSEQIGHARKNGRTPPLWDGHAAERIRVILEKAFVGAKETSPV
jgi:UDP-N-acetylglucosamine 2-epimerase (non-hydrolysing)